MFRLTIKITRPDTSKDFWFFSPLVTQSYKDLGKRLASEGCYIALIDTISDDGFELVRTIDYPSEKEYVYTQAQFALHVPDVIAARTAYQKENGHIRSDSTEQF